MKLIMKTSMQGHEIGLSRGDQHDAEDAEGIRLIDAGFASAVDTAEETEARARLAEAAEKGVADDNDPTAEDAGGDADNSEGRGAQAPAYADLGAARTAYKDAFGKGAGPSWSIEQIAAKIAEKAAQG